MTYDEIRRHIDDWDGLTPGQRNRLSRVAAQQGLVHLLPDIPPQLQAQLDGHRRPHAPEAAAKAIPTDSIEILGADESDGVLIEITH